MKTVFYNIYKVLRLLIVVGIGVFATIFILLYLVLLTPFVQNSLKGVAEDELSALLNTKVNIENVSIEPFNKIIIHNLDVDDQSGNDLLKIDKLGAGFSWYNLIVRGRLVFTHAELIGLDGNIYKQTKDSDTNIQFLIDALSSKDNTKDPSTFDISIYNIVLRKSKLSYNVLSDTIIRNSFDLNHINIGDLRADISLPRIENDNFNIKVKRLSFTESCGLDVRNITLNTKIGDSGLKVSDFRIELPNTLIKTNDFEVFYPALKSIGKDISKLTLNLDVSNSVVTLSDLACFVPQLSDVNFPLDVTLKASGTLNKLNLSSLNVKSTDDKIKVEVKGYASDIYSLDSIFVDVPKLYISARSNEIVNLLAEFIPLKKQLRDMVLNSGYVSIDANVKGSLNDAHCNGRIATNVGVIILDGINIGVDETSKFRGNVSTESFNLGTLLGKSDLLGEVVFDLSLNGKKNRRGIIANLEGYINSFEFKGYRYKNVSTNIKVDKSNYSLNLIAEDENLDLRIDGGAFNDGENSSAQVNMSVSKLNLATLNLNNKYPNHVMSFNVSAAASGNKMTNFLGNIVVDDFNYLDSLGTGFVIDNLNIIADNTQTPYKIDIKSDVFNGGLVGSYEPKKIVPTIKQILAKVCPSLFIDSDIGTFDNSNENDFKFSFNIADNDKTNSILNFFSIPINVAYPVEIEGFVNETNNAFNLDINAPFLARKGKLIENSSIKLGIDSLSSQLNLFAATTMPGKRGKITYTIDVKGKNDCLNTNLGWVVDREGQYNGNINFTTALGRVNETNKLMSTITVNPTICVFNDTTWNVHSSKIGIYNKTIRVDDLKVTSDDQFVWIDGRSTPEGNENINVELKNINLDYIFDILQINNVVFGGNATGKAIASNILSKTPKLETENLYVENFSYNKSLLGNADLKSFWDNDSKFVAIQALVEQPNGKNSIVDGEIYPTKDSLRFDFTAEKLNAGFMKPFLSSISSDVDGLATGHVRLFGTFNKLDLSGDVFVEDLKFKVDYTNVCYFASDSLILRPGLIKFNDIEVRDKFGNTALLNGEIKHKKFKDIVYDINVTDAQSILCYDIPEKKVDSWYGTIFGNGSVFINGNPGLLKIDVGMSTAQDSKFYFELSSEESAVEYNFITFTDKRKEKLEAIRIVNQTPEDSIKMRFVNNTNVNSTSSRIVVNIKADVNPLGQLILVMDPIAGDKIKATGTGTVTVAYDSNTDLEVRGKYTLEKGLYNFTLQDIIRKDFIINEGSYIYFDGNPYEAKIDINAVYALNANLLDLDEGFATDKELTRTNVPVHAVLNVTGSIAEPDINFDLQFPTLSSDAYRKVKSIVSTDDMMNRQIIYLLALNRFYTPEYMGGTNRNNELASVASSTISSQLSSMLGQINENWSIAPNFKSDRGDFSDVEVNLALSSQLLNNRLLFNGNFGYRDKMASTSNTNFIGDFDIEYLLNKAGNIRLKAYNHFNDQNYYVKNALTTQGVGVVFKYDFDKLFRTQRNNINNDSIFLKDSIKQDSIIIKD